MIKNIQDNLTEIVIATILIGASMFHVAWVLTTIN
jgi:hypothetical protein